MLIRPADDGTFTLAVPGPEAELLAGLCTEMVGRLRSEGWQGEGALRRLFPPAHPDDPDQEAAYREVVGDALRRSRIHDLEVVAATVRGRSLDREQLESWMRAVNALRLVLGTELDVSEDRDPLDVGDDDPRLVDHILYDDLSGLLALIVGLLAGP